MDIFISIHIPLKMIIFEFDVKVIHLVFSANLFSGDRRECRSAVPGPRVEERHVRERRGHTDPCLEQFVFGYLRDRNTTFNRYFYPGEIAANDWGTFINFKIISIDI